eukprot:CAMPEP_0114639720 /NCGR_PEP_ID=MMETSP0191-20121206/1319_1 /TAXON_ID=126664 /ORGANISM="Sorites sp." /LENGTH=506 /DNA_ID=CAMNT_0001851603 /DNA_START=39 /DNA_END=1559 /DNA_ORIENTATION=+
MTDEQDVPTSAALVSESADAPPLAQPLAEEVDELKAELARRVQQPASRLKFLEPLPPKLLRIICENFDEAGTKDGQMLHRLEAYTRSVARRNQLTLEPPSLPEVYAKHGSAAAVDKIVETFVKNDLELEDDMLDLIRCLERNLQIEVVEQFEVDGTRDGNVQHRFFSFIRGIWLRHLGVSREVSDLIRDCPDDLQAEIMKNFDPTGTKDGNLSARLHSFVTRSWRNSKKSKAYKKHSKKTLEGFVRYWKLEPWALEVLWALPLDVQDEVLNGFDGSCTRDGYVGGRFLGYARNRWTKYLKLDEDCCYAVKRLPEEGQVMCLTQFDPSSTRDGNVSARLRSFLWKVENKLADDADGTYDSYGWSGWSGGQNAQGWQPHESWSPQWHEQAYGGYKDAGMRDAILKFVARWNLDLAVGAYLEKLKDPDVVARVLEEFDPTGTQDGNVLFRLKSFVGLLCSRRKRGELNAQKGEGYHEAEAPTRSRKEKWQKKAEMTRSAERDNRIASII